MRSFHAQLILGLSFFSGSQAADTALESMTSQCFSDVVNVYAQKENEMIKLDSNIAYFYYLKINVFVT